MKKTEAEAQIEVPMQPMQPDPEPEHQGTPLDIVDIVNAHRIIGEVITRGGKIFEPKEIVDICSVYSKLTTFIETLKKEGGE